MKRIFIKILAWVLLWILFGISWVSWIGAGWLSISLSMLALILFITLEIRKRPTQSHLVQLINNQFKSTQYSTELIFDRSTSGLQAIQRDKVLGLLNSDLPNFEYPIRWFNYKIVSILLLAVFSLGLGFKKNNSPIPIFGESDTSQKISVQKASQDSVLLESIEVSIVPPIYTRLGNVKKAEPNIEFPEGSLLEWKLSFEGEPTQSWIKTSTGDSLVFARNNEIYSCKYRPKASGFYIIFFRYDDIIINSPFYELKMIGDELPSAEFVNISQVQRIDFEQEKKLTIEMQFQDDYGLSDAYVTATITKGSGESIKFREQKIQLNPKISGKKATRKWEFKLSDFEMEPGNELYFYATAADNKPIAQQSRTETYFIILNDTAKTEFSLQGALGVDLMPDYFRSQLQIILDTEKLLKDRSQITLKEFNHESNALGYDQKQLRLKYGQFIGEEEDSGLEIENEASELVTAEDTETENILQEFGHDTDHENEEGQWMDRGTDPNDPGNSKNPLAQYIHNHDDAETATFHTQTLKDKLRAALNEMWDAELYLRLFKPEQSLPYQYRAHEMLKEIRNHARIYVQRIGFEPPPVNEDESRLTGKLNELNRDPFTMEKEHEITFPGIRKAIIILDNSRLAGSWDSGERKILERAGSELAGLAIETPGEYLLALNILREIIDADQLNTTQQAQIVVLKKELEKVIKESNPMPNSTTYPDDELSRHYLKTLLTSDQK